MLDSLTSLILVFAFGYGLSRNFKKGNYAYSFVMYAGAVIFYANLYHTLSRSLAFCTMMVALFLAIILAIVFIYRAIQADNGNRHYWGATALCGISIILVIIFKFIL